MRWEDSRLSDNVEDRRDESYSGGSGGHGGGLGVGAIIVLGLLGYAFGIDPRLLISGAQMASDAYNGARSNAYVSPANRQTGTPSDQAGKFVAAVLGENEDVWGEILPAQAGMRFVNPKLVLFRGATESGCGGARAQMGPFYCPLDQKIYLDLSFFKDMKSNLGGGGEFAYAYVISHEMGHHIQNQLGLLNKVQRAEKNAPSQAQANALSVRVELMADCLAGVWAYHANAKWRNIDPTDIQQAISTAQAIGDDRLQKASRGYAVPDSFTHGTSAQRVAWLQKGLGSGQISACDTFSQ